MISLIPGIVVSRRARSWIGASSFSHVGIDFRERALECGDQLEVQAQESAVMRRDAPVERFDQFRALAAGGALREIGQRRRDRTRRAISASRIARPLAPTTLESTLASLTLASSSVFWMRSVC